MKAKNSLIFFGSVLTIFFLLSLIFPESGISFGKRSDSEDTLSVKVDSLALDSIEDARLSGQLDDTTMLAEDDSIVQYESDFLSQLKHESITLHFPTFKQAITSKTNDNESAEGKLRKAEEELKLQIVQDSLDKVNEEKLAQEEKEKKAFQDTLKSYQHFATTSSARLYFPNDNFHLMDKLFASLQNCGNGKVVHVLHYGDSQIESDRITGYIREQFQQKFGGYGPGTCPAIQPIRSYTVVQSFSDSLPRYIADGTMRQKLSDDHYGVLAQMARLNGKVTLSYATCNNSKVYNRARKFSQVRLLVGNTGENFSAKLRWGGNDSTQVIEAATPEFSTITWKLDTMVSSVKLDLSGSAEIYGVAMDGKSGISMDNIPLRGSSGTFFTRISSHLLSSAMKELNVKLILLEFGGNYTPHIYSLDRVEKYKQMISSQIRYIKGLHPDAFIILIGPADMSQKINGELQTYPFLEENIEGMKQAALENGAAFWDMYQVMGGKNSMIKWVDHVPAWAASDYIHFTPTGAGRIADMFVQSFMNYYDYYRFLKRNKKWSEEMKETKETRESKDNKVIKESKETKETKKK